MPQSDGSALLRSSVDCGAALTCQTAGGAVFVYRRESYNGQQPIFPVGPTARWRKGGVRCVASSKAGSPCGRTTPVRKSFGVQVIRPILLYRGSVSIAGRLSRCCSPDGSHLLLVRSFFDAFDVMSVFEGVFNGEISEFLSVVVLDAGGPVTVEAVVLLDRDHSLLRYSHPHDYTV